MAEEILTELHVNGVLASVGSHEAGMQRGNVDEARLGRLANALNREKSMLPWCVCG